LLSTIPSKENIMKNISKLILTLIAVAYLVSLAIGLVFATGTAPIVTMLVITVGYAGLTGLFFLVRGLERDDRAVKKVQAQANASRDAVFTQIDAHLDAAAASSRESNEILKRMKVRS
jgi:Flp pilus assembly protein TadB